MILISVGAAFLIAALLYKNRRDEEILSETLEHYINLAESLTIQIKQQRELTAFLAHDLKSPLAGIVSSAHALELAGNSLPPAYRECLRLMQTSGRTNLRLLSNFIELIGSEHARESLQAFPENHLDLLQGLIDPILSQEKMISWVACPWLLKTKVPLRPFAAAFSEIISFACSRKKGGAESWPLRIEESFDSEAKQLRLSIAGLPKLSAQSNDSSCYPYSLALQVIEKMGVEFVTIDQSDESVVLELIIPICEAAACDSQAEVSRDQRAHAELLVELSVRQVRSAALSIGSITELRKVKDEDEEADQLEAESVTV